MNYRKNLNPPSCTVAHGLLLVCYLFILDTLARIWNLWDPFRANYSLPYVKKPINFLYRQVSNLSPIFKKKKKKNRWV